MQLSGTKLKAIRQERSWSQEVLATASGLSLRTIQRLEATGNVSAESFLCIAAALDVAPSKLKDDNDSIKATWTGEMPSPQLNESRRQLQQFCLLNLSY